MTGRSAEDPKGTEFLRHKVAVAVKRRSLLERLQYQGLKSAPRSGLLTDA